MELRHGEAFTITDHLTVWDDEQAAYRPTVCYAYCPSNAAIASLWELRGRNYKIQPRERILYDEITSGCDILGALIMGHPFTSWWCGSDLSIDESRRLVPGQNATTMQVAISVVAAVMWMIEHPLCGFRVPDELPHEAILKVAKPYLGDFISTPSDWTPLADYENPFEGYNQPQQDPDDVWQFKNFFVHRWRVSEEPVMTPRRAAAGNGQAPRPWIDGLITSGLPRDHFPADGADPDTVCDVLTEELLLDGNSKQNLATFCQTWESPQVHRLMDLAIDKNLIDKDEYPQTAEIEQRCIALLADLWHAPGQPVGCSTVGSSEAAMLGGMAAKWRWRARRKAAGKPADQPNMVCGSVQICWKKFARYWDIEMREVEMKPGRLCLEPEDVLAQVDDNTIFVVPTLGVTYHGLYEDVAGIAAALDGLQQQTGLDVPIHVDAASGGFVAPFTDPDHASWDFRLPRVKSINASGHKFGLAPLGVGWVLWREPADLPDDLVFHVSYLGGDMPTFQINFSRPAGQVIAQYFDFVRLGRAGYTTIHEESHAVAQYCAGEIGRLDGFEIVHDGDPKRGIPTVVWTLAEGVAKPYTLYDLADRLRMRGWQVPAYPFTGELAGKAFQRILVKRDFNREMAALLLRDIRQAVAYLEARPAAVGGAAAQGGYSHV